MQAKASLAFNTERVERYKGLLPDDYVSILNHLQYKSNKETAEGQIVEYEVIDQKSQSQFGVLHYHFTHQRTPRKTPHRPRQHR